MRALFIERKADADTSQDGQLGRQWGVVTVGPPAYPVLRMQPMENHAGLVVWGALSQQKPADDATPESILDVPLPGTAFRFGEQGLLILLSQPPHGPLYFMVSLRTEQPTTLYGHGHFFSAGQMAAPTENADQQMLPFEPHCEVTMKRVGDANLQDHE